MVSYHHSWIQDKMLENLQDFIPTLAEKYGNREGMPNCVDH